MWHLILPVIAAMSLGGEEMELPSPASAPPALSSCPGPGALADGGVELTFDDGARTVLTLQPSGLVLEETFFENSEDDFWLESWRGVYSLADGLYLDGEIDRAGQLVRDYGVPREALPEPSPGDVWSGMFMETDGGGAGSGPYEAGYEVGPLRPLIIGACSYQAMEISTRLVDDQGLYTAKVEYIPSIGVAIQTASGGDGLDDEIYTPISIEARR